MIDHTKPYFITPCISIHPDEMYIYNKIDWIDGKRKVSEKSKLNLIDNTTHSKLSDKSKKKAKRAIKYLIYNSTEKTAFNHKTQSTFKFKVNFITLTLSSAQIHTDQEIKSILLNQFLIEAKKRWGLKNYVWKGERQKNGNIHFHLLSDVWIPWLELRNVWNRIQNKLGYIDRYSATSHKSNPNSTDVHSLKKVQNVAAYMIKYMTKDYKGNHVKVSSKIVPKLKGLGKDNISISGGAKAYLSKLSNCGRIWTCSKELSNIKGAQHELEQGIESEIEKLKKMKSVRSFEKDYVQGIFYINGTLNSVDFPILSYLLTDYVCKLFGQPSQLILNYS